MQVLPDIIELFHEKYSLVSFDIFTANADLVFDFIRLAEKERWVVLMRTDDPLAEKDAVCAKDL